MQISLSCHSSLGVLPWFKCWGQDCDDLWIFTLLTRCLSIEINDFNLQLNVNKNRKSRFWHVKNLPSKTHSSTHPRRQAWQWPVSCRQCSAQCIRSRHHRTGPRCVQQAPSRRAWGHNLLLVVKATGGLPMRCQRTVGCGSPETRHSNVADVPADASTSRGGRRTIGGAVFQSTVIQFRLQFEYLKTYYYKKTEMHISGQSFQSTLAVEILRNKSSNNIWETAQCYQRNSKYK